MTLSVPGVYVTENTYGSIPAILNTFDAVYVLGSSDNSQAPVNTPTYVSSVDDFKNVFGASSPSASAIQLFFDQRSGYGLYFINVQRRAERTIEVTVFSEGTELSLTIDGTTLTYTCVANETAESARDKLGALVNNQLPLIASYRDGFLRYVSDLSVSSSANVTLGSPSTPSVPMPRDVADCLMVAFEPGMRQGFICAPELFKSYVNQTSRVALQQTLEAFAADPGNYFVALIDPGQTTATSSGAISAVMSERADFVSPRGHSWYYFPYLVNLQGTQVPPSLAVAGVYLRRMRNEGFAQPAAGVNYPIYGVTGTSFRVDDKIQSQLNPLGINCIRKLPQGRGIVVYGARTLSTSSYYRFGSIRVILNVLASSLKSAYDTLVLSLADGQGVLFSRIKQTAAALCELLRLQGALYGATPDEAYLVICDNTNNTPDQLEAGEVTVDVIVKPSPTMEVLKVSLQRASLGTVFAEVQDSGSLEAPEAST